MPLVRPLCGAKNSPQRTQRTRSPEKPLFSAHSASSAVKIKRLSRPHSLILQLYFTRFRYGGDAVLYRYEKFVSCRNLNCRQSSLNTIEIAECFCAPGVTFRMLIARND